MADSYNYVGSYYNEDNSLIYSQSEETKEELFFEFDGYRQPKTVDEIETVANMIHTLLFLEPGTYPDSPNMGIAIQNYEFELLNDTTITKIRKKITDQISTYLSNITLRDLVVKNISNNNIKNALGIGFAVSINSYEKVYEFFLVINEEPDTRELISNIFY